MILCLNFIQTNLNLKNTILREYFFDQAMEIEIENRKRELADEPPIPAKELNEKLREFFIKRTQEIQEQNKNAALNLINTSSNLFLMS